MSFKYNLTEFCTSIKPFCFTYLIKHFGFEKVIYLDPDILVYNSFDQIFKDLSQYSIILTPHILNIQPIYSGDLAENSFLNTGVFNLGFLAIRKNETVLNMLQWWANRLIEHCYIEMLDAYFT